MIHNVQLGCVAYSYKEMIGPFYRPRTKTANLLKEYAGTYNTVELANTFYAVPSETTVQGWDRDTPEGFVFAAKVWQKITHIKRFKECDADLNAFVEAMAPLGAKLGPMLLQCPPNLSIASLPAVEPFLGKLPREFRWAIEFRHPSWLTDDVQSMLRDNNVCLAAADQPGMPVCFAQTADFSYIRLMGDRKKVTEVGAVILDRSEEVKAWAAEVTGPKVDVENGWLFVSNWYSGLAPDTLQLLAAALDKPPFVFPVGKPAT